jgi:hypothetical protein
MVGIPSEIAAVKSVSCLARRKIIKIKIVIHMEQNNQEKNLYPQWILEVSY